jgi:radical SAM superfamily enzyme YgiQ (UPF0313 family)
VRKGFTHADVVRIREECRKLGIVTFGFFMIGFPFENRETIEDTIRFAKALDCEIVEFNKVVPYAKTELYEIVKDGGYMLQDQAAETRSYHEGITTAGSAI